jgi:hypothetical protein
MTTIEQLEESQRDIIAVLQWLGATKTPTEKIASAMQRLLVQLPQSATDNLPSFSELQKIEKARVEKLKNPLPSVPYTPVVPDGVERADLLAKLKRPSFVQQRSATNENQQRLAELERLKTGTGL